MNAARLVAMAATCALVATGLATPAAQATVPVQAAVTDGVNGVVWATAQVGDRSYVGGDFTWAGPWTGAAGVVNATDGKRTLNSTSRIRGTVHAAAPDGAGGWYIGGDFVYAGGLVRNGAARLHSTGYVTGWNPNPGGGAVRAVAVTPSTVFLGGSFTTMGGQARNYLAAVDRTSNAVTSWSSNVNGAVTGLAVSADNATLYVAGSFTSLGGANRANLGAISTATGLATSWDPAVNGAVASIAPAANAVYIAGTFTSAGGAARSSVAALSSTTGAATPFTADTNGPAHSVAVDAARGVAYVGGLFSTVKGEARSNIAAVDTTTGNPTSWAASTNGVVNSIAVSADGATVYATGDFRKANAADRNRTAAFSSAATADLTGWHPSADAAGLTLTFSKTQLLVGGVFQMLNGLPRNNLAALRADGTVDPTFDPNVNGVVYALAGAPDGTRLYVGGKYTAVGGLTRYRMAAVDPASGAVSTTWKPGFNATVRSIAAAGTRVYIGGAFTTATAGVSIPRLASVSAATGAVDTSFRPAPNDTVRGLVVHPNGTKLYACGPFTSLGGANRPGGAELNATTGALTSFAPEYGGYGLSCDLTPDGSRFFFSTSSNRVWVYDPAVSNTLLYDVRTTGDVQDMAATDDEVYIGGHFSSFVNTKLYRLHAASFNVADGSPTSWNPVVDGIKGVWALTVANDRLLMGGDFTRVNNKPQPGFATYVGTP